MVVAEKMWSGMGSGLWFWIVFFMLVVLCVLCVGFSFGVSIFMLWRGGRIVRVVMW